jgi:hypothetical protein
VSFQRYTLKEFSTILKIVLVANVLMSNVTNENKLKEIKKIVRSLENGYVGSLKLGEIEMKKLQHIRWLVESIENSKESLWQDLSLGITLRTENPK